MVMRLPFPSPPTAAGDGADARCLSGPRSSQIATPVVQNTKALSEVPVRAGLRRRGLWPLRKPATPIRWMARHRRERLLASRP
ncbi:hypothetical protein ACFPM0_11455 [Pseudonocardia sulfidoxydans]|uniref:hypothetical protein n=1 Tax=Pseudonocardia sulfidoxydans TaxID=54011 RepID=UPI0036109D83